MIAAYLTFFPVTVNMLRGLRSADPRALALMRALAASRRQIFLKLRFPAALPYLFTALKISATASVVGAIIGELPVGDPGAWRGDLNVNQYYIGVAGEPLGGQHHRPRCSGSSSTRPWPPPSGGPCAGRRSTCA